MYKILFDRVLIGKVSIKYNNKKLIKWIYYKKLEREQRKAIKK